MTDRVAIFIDSANVFHTCVDLNLRIDWFRFRQFFETQFSIKRIYYYTALIEEENGRITKKPLFDWLSQNGFTLITKPAKIFTNSKDGVRRVKGNMDMEMAMDMVRTARQGHVERIILVSGDGDFMACVKHLQMNEDVRVTVVSSRKTNPPRVDEELRKQVDQFIELDLLRAEIESLDRRASVETLEGRIKRMVGGK